MFPITIPHNSELVSRSTNPNTSLRPETSSVFSCPSSATFLGAMDALVFGFTSFLLGRHSELRLHRGQNIGPGGR